MVDEFFLKGLATALGIGLLLGVVRERKHAPDKAEAGLRTHTLIAILGATCWQLGIIPFTVTLLILGAFVVSSYIRVAHKDPGLTGEVTVIVNFALAGLALETIEVAAGLGVLSAILLQAKRPLHRISRDIINEQEVRDGLLLLASTLIIMPLLPSKPIDKWGVIKLTTVWKIVILILATGMFGHIARRMLGAKFGLPIAGFFSGFVSSTAAIASLGHKAKNDPKNMISSSAAALLANLSSLILFIGIIATVSKELFRSMFIPFLLSTIFLGIVIVISLFHHMGEKEQDMPDSGQAFKLSHALIIAVAISGILFASAWLNETFGGVGVILTTIIAAMAEIHASAASLAQLSSEKVIPLKMAQWGVIGALASSTFTKIVLSYISGGKDFALRLSIGLVMMVIGAALGVIIF
ncbi:MAG TPA: MgtC/SapB family protein [Bacteriovoracaceae bacterium]|nr:MgtC/SapB family protein [Bacteriovoracaceae bacterium]